MLLTTLALLPLAFATPQTPQYRPDSRLRLPPPDERAAAAPRQPVTPATELERFRMRLFDLASSSVQQDQVLDQLPREFRDIEELVLASARKLGARDLQLLMLVARRHGTPRIADELLFQALARPLGDATRDVLTTMVTLKGPEEGRKALVECVKGRVNACRRQATDLLAAVATPELLPFALQLAAEPSLDLQLSAVQLLAAIADDRARQRLVEMLSRDATIASAACAGLIRGGAANAKVLRQVLDQPPIDRGWASCAFALACIGEAAGQGLLQAKDAPLLQQQLQQSDVGIRVAAAVALADLLWRGEVTAAAGVDAAVVECLLQVVAPQGFVPGIDLLRKPAEARLLRLSGRAPGGDVRPWRQWWTDVQADFVAVRSKVEVTAAQADAVLVVLRSDRSVLRLLGEALATLPPVANAQEVLLTRDDMTALVRALQAGGFGDPQAVRLPDGMPVARTLSLQVAGARAQVAAPAGELPAFDAMAGLVQAAFDRELWQLFRDPATAPDRAAWWRSEQEWRRANPEALPRERRLLRTVLAQWPTLPGNLRARALEHFFTRAPKDLLEPADGKAILAVLRAMPAPTPTEDALVELAVACPGDEVWRDLVEFRWQQKGDGRAAAAKLFALLGGDRVLAALADPRPALRLAALEAVVQSRDLRAGGRIAQLLQDPDADVALAAAFAAGALPAVEARPFLLQRIADQATLPGLRRQCLKSLGRVGGDKAFAVLERAMAAPDVADREAALRGMGELREPAAATLLAELFVVSHQGEVGDLCRFFLQRMGSRLAVPALRTQLQVQNRAARSEVVLMLGGWQDPGVLPDLLELLRAGDTLRATAMLEGITGLDLTGAGDQAQRAQAVERWFRDHRNEEQWQWLLAALSAAGVPTTLKAADFDAAAGLQPVPELARLMVECEAPRLRLLAMAVLRERTGEDYGLLVPETPVDVREAMAAKYRILFESRAGARR